MPDVLAIVGSTEFACPAGEDIARHLIADELTSRRPDRVVSGGAKGVDTIGVAVAARLGIDYTEHHPGIRRWDGPNGFKARNQLIARDCSRALAQVGRDVETHIAKAHRDLAALRPTPGADQTAYLAAKRRHDEQTTARLHFRGIVTRRTEEVASLVGPDPANRLMVGNLIHILLHIAALADDDDIEAVKSAALGLAEKFANQTRQP